VRGLAAAEGWVAAVAGINLDILELGLTQELVFAYGLHQFYFIYQALKLSKNQHKLAKLNS
jgi:hypothetical protein